MKRNIVFAIIAIIIIVLISIYFFKNNNTQNNNNNNNDFKQIDEDSNVDKAENRIENILQNSKSQEIELSSYATTIKDKEAGRLTNISITCSTLDNTIVHKRRNFFF